VMPNPPPQLPPSSAPPSAGPPPPAPAATPAAAPLPPGWEEKQDGAGRSFYIDHNTKQTTWRRPPM
jgi:hypothetical protein